MVSGFHLSQNATVDIRICQEFAAALTYETASKPFVSMGEPSASVLYRPIAHCFLHISECNSQQAEPHRDVFVPGQDFMHRSGLGVMQGVDDGEAVESES